MEQNSLFGMIIIGVLVLTFVIVTICLCVKLSQYKKLAASAPQNINANPKLGTVMPITQNTTQDNTTVVELDDVPDSQIRTLNMKNGDDAVLSAERKEQLEDIA